MSGYPDNPVGNFAGKLPQTSWSVAQSYRDPGERRDDAERMADRLRTIIVDTTVDGDVLYGRARGAVGFVHRIDGPWLEQWANANLPTWQHLTADGWVRAARQLAAWVRDRDAGIAAAIPPDAARAAELTAERARADRRAELERQAAENAAEMAALERGEPVEPEPTCRGGWLRRTSP